MFLYLVILWVYKKRDLASRVLRVMSKLVYRGQSSLYGWFFSLILNSSPHFLPRILSSTPLPPRMYNGDGDYSPPKVLLSNPLPKSFSQSTSCPLPPSRCMGVSIELSPDAGCLRHNCIVQFIVFEEKSVLNPEKWACHVRWWRKAVQVVDCHSRRLKF